MSLKKISIPVMIFLMMLESTFFGSSDAMSVVFILLSTFIIFATIFDIQRGHRLTLRAHTKEGGFLHGFLSQKKPVLLYIVSFIGALIASVMLMVTMKVLIIKQGYWAFFLILFITSFLIHSLLNFKDIRSGQISNNLQQDIANHANNIISILILVIVLNLFLVACLSAHDTMTQISSNVTFENFDEYTVHKSIEQNGNNHYTRIMINLYLLVDYTKEALTNKIMEILIPDMQDRLNAYYQFYIVTFILNFVKLLPFVLSFVLMQRGIETYATQIVSAFKPIVRWIKKVIRTKVQETKECEKSE